MASLSGAVNGFFVRQDTVDRRNPLVLVGVNSHFLPGRCHDRDPLGEGQLPGDRGRWCLFSLGAREGKASKGKR
jgi:hypothetical protein